jgi:hypothetical protein
MPRHHRQHPRPVRRAAGIHHGTDFAKVPGAGMLTLTALLGGCEKPVNASDRPVSYWAERTGCWVTEAPTLFIETATSSVFPAH